MTVRRPRAGATPAASAGSVSLGTTVRDHGPLVVMALPFLVALVAGGASDWAPSGDVALEALRMGDVGTDHTPLVGVYSRFGWSHPGPLLLWSGAPFLTVLGPPGMLVLAALVNAVSVVVAGSAARRLGGRALAWVLAGCVLVALYAAGPAQLSNPWNPYVAVLPLLAFLLCAPAAATGVRWALPAAAVAGTFALQSHLGPAPVIVVATLAAAAWAGVERRRPADTSPTAARRGPGRVWVVGTLVLLLALWSGPLVDQAVGEPRNLSAIASFVVEGDEPVAPLGDTLGVAARELGVPPAWVGGQETVAPGPLVRQGAPWTLGLVAVVLGAAGLLAWRGRDRTGLRLVAFAALLWLTAVGAVTRIVGVLVEYLVRWTWPVGILVAMAVIDVGWRAVTPLTAGRARLGRPAAALAAGILVLASLVLAGRAATDEARPLEVQSGAVRGLSAAVQAEVPPGSYAFDWFDLYDLGGVPVGVAVDLIDHGYDLEVTGDTGVTFGDFRTGTGRGRDAITIVGARTGGAWTPPPGAERVATFDALSAEDRAQLTEVEDRIRRDVAPPISGPVLVDSEATVDDLVAAGGDPDDLRTALRLQRLGDAYEVWLTPAP